MPRLVVLGSGTSTGVPMQGCDCPTCRSEDPRDTRWRASVLLEDGDARFVVDTPPEFRLQCLREGVDSLDAVFLTHSHADHISGLDDVRLFTLYGGGPVPVHADTHTCDVVRVRYSYIFRDAPPGVSRPRIDLRAVTEPVRVGGMEVVPVPVMHGTEPVLGYRTGDLAYVTDVSSVPEASKALLADLDVLILDAVRPDPHPTHFCLDEALATVEELAPRRAWFTHLSHRMNHAETSASLPEGVGLLHDGMRIDF